MVVVVVVVVKCLSLSMFIFAVLLLFVLLSYASMLMSVMDEVNKILLLWGWMSSFELWQMSGVGTSGS